MSFKSIFTDKKDLKADMAIRYIKGQRKTRQVDFATLIFKLVENKQSAAKRETCYRITPPGSGRSCDPGAFF